MTTSALSDICDFIIYKYISFLSTYYNNMVYVKFFRYKRENLTVNYIHDTPVTYTQLKLPTKLEE